MWVNNEAAKLVAKSKEAFNALTTLPRKAVAELSEAQARTRIEQKALQQLKTELPGYRAYGFKLDHLIRLDGSVGFAFSGKLALSKGAGAKEVKTVEGIFNVHDNAFHAFKVSAAPMGSDAMVWSTAARQKLGR